MPTAIAKALSCQEVSARQGRLKTNAGNALAVHFHVIFRIFHFFLILPINIGQFRENIGRFSVDSVSVNFSKSSVDFQSILTFWFSLHT